DSDCPTGFGRHVITFLGTWLESSNIQIVVVGDVLLVSEGTVKRDSSDEAPIKDRVLTRKKSEAVSRCPARRNCFAPTVIPRGVEGGDERSFRRALQSAATKIDRVFEEARKKDIVAGCNGQRILNEAVISGGATSKVLGPENCPHRIVLRKENVDVSW